MKLRRHLKKNPRKDRKFIDRADMRMIRWDTCVVRSQLKREGKSEDHVITLHAWGCGCCFTLVRPLKEASRTEE